jgi:hypothetical protein
VESTLGLEDYPERGQILPLAKTKEGKTVFAWPQFGIDMAKSAMTPGYVAQGGSVTPEDVVDFTLNYGVSPTMRAKPGHKSTTTRDLVENAPSTQALKAKGSAQFKAAENTGVRLKAEKYMDFVLDVNDIATKNKTNPVLHKYLTGVVKELETKVGAEPDVGDLIITRRQLASVARTTAPELEDERRIAMDMIDRLDDTVNTLSNSDVVSGDATSVGSKLAKARKTWSQGAKSQIIDDIMERAETQASGKENGIRIGFRQLLRDKKRIRGFSQEEQNFMKTIVNGTFFTRAKRFAGTMSPFRGGQQSFLGASIGAGAGATIGNAIAGTPGAIVGSMAVPAIGAIAKGAAERATTRRAELARAMATGALDTPVNDMPAALGGAAMRAAPRIAPTAMPEDSAGGPGSASGLVEKMIRDWFTYYSGEMA